MHVASGGVSNLWATDPISSAAPEDGRSYVIAAYVNSKYYALPNGTVSGATISGAEIELNAIGKVSTSVASGKTWTLTEGTGDNAGKYYIEYTSGDDTYGLYKNGTGKNNYNFAVNKTSRNYWSFTTNGTGYTVAAVDRGTNNVNIQCNSGTFRCYSTATPIILLEVGDVPTYTLTINTPSNGSITVTDENDDPVSSGDKFAAGTELIVVAEADPGYSFSAWTGTTAAYANTGSTSTTFTMPSSTATIDATFISASSPAAVVSESSLAFGDVEVGKTKDLTFTITPSNLTSDLSISVPLGSKYSVSPTSIAQATTTEQTITVTAAPTALADDMDETITISGGGLAANKSVTLSATPYQVANVTLSATNGVIQQGGVTKTSITSRVGNTATLTAVPNDGYIFDSWTIVGATPTSSTAAETEFTFTATTVTLTANFILDPKEYATLADEIPTPDANGKYDDDAVEIEEDGFTWILKGYTAKSLKMLQMRTATADGESYIKLPEFPGAIQTIVFSVTSASGTSKGAAATTNVLSLRDVDGTTGAGIIASSESTSSTTRTIDLTAKSQKYSTGYITASAAIRIWDITVSYLPAEDAEVDITSAKYATFSDYVARDFSGSGITVCKAACDGSVVTLTEIADGIVPAYEGVVLFCNEVKTDEPIPAATTASAGDFSDNDLMASDGSVTGDGSNIYALGYKSSKAGFYLVGDGVTVPAGKAYLIVAAPVKEFLNFDFGEDSETAIESLTPALSEGEGVVYDLSGRRVQKPTKGLYIVNGKKVMF